MSMEQFVKQKISETPAVTIRKNGSISFNSMAAQMLPIQGKTHAALFFDKEEKAIGIQPIDPEPGIPAFIISREKEKTYTIGCRSFLRHCEISFKQESKVYPAEWDAEKEMIVVKLS